MKFTQKQSQVIKADVSNILVSAAAGSGKTAVLTERIVQRISKGQVDVQNILVMTFTDAAAREMKQRIESRLRQVLSEEKDSKRRQYLGQQLSLLPGASISTIHSFCLNVIRNFAYTLKDDSGQPLIDSSFSVDDGIEADLLLTECLDEWMNLIYEQVDQREEAESTKWAKDLFHLLDGYGSSHNDLAVRSLILEIFYYLRSLPDYNRFIDSKLGELQQAAENFSDSPHAAELLRELRLRLARALDVLPELENLLAGGIRFLVDKKKNQAQHRQFCDMISVIRDLDKWLQSGGSDWDEIRRRSSSLSDISLARASRNDEPEKQIFARLFLDNVAELIYFLTGACGTPKYKEHFIYETKPVFTLSTREIEADIRFMLPIIARLFDLVKGLDAHYFRRKREGALIDFADFEHLALTILRQEEAKNYYRNKFREIYVDEYQDTSSIQEAIIRQISDGNCLVVGDIKQSIYKFRHARPRLFISRAEQYRDGKEGHLHELNRNFRSVAGILQAVNFMFYQLMSRGAGEIEYDSSQELIAQREDEPAIEVPVQIMLLNRGEQENDPADFVAESTSDNEDIPEDSLLEYDQLDREQKEALLVVRQIYRLQREGRRWQDMAVLCRTRNIAAAYSVQLSRHGIPVLEGKDSEYLDLPALRVAESLVHVLDNSRQDIPLAAIMRSSLLENRFSDDELLQIRLGADNEQLQDNTFASAVCYFAESGQGQLREKTAGFLALLETWRDQEKYMPVGELLDKIFRQTGWLDRLALLPEGTLAVQMIRQFVRRAEQFEYKRQRGLYSFARYLETLRASNDLGRIYGFDQQNDDGVRVITIHGSKGLEFPVVFLAGTNYSLSPRDSKSPLLISETLGIGMNFADPDRQIRYPTHLKLAMQQEIRASSMAEEMRLLYVAMTRARDQLFLVGSVNLHPEKGAPRLAKIISQVRRIKSMQLPDYLVLSGKSYLEWLIMALARQKHIDLSPLENGEPLPENAVQSADINCSSIGLKWIDYAELLSDVQRYLQIESSAGEVKADDVPAEQNPDEKIIAFMQNRILAAYRYTRSTRIPAKITVSDLKRREDELARDDTEAENDFVRSDLEDVPTSADDPRGINLSLRYTELTQGEKTDTKGRGAAIGTILHTILRYLDLKIAREQSDRAEIEHQIGEMIKFGMLSRDDAAKISSFVPDLLVFVHSELAAEMIAAATKGKAYFVEIPFTLGLPAAELYKDREGLAPDDQVMIQGIIDCWYETDGKITLVDFKSDYIEGNEQDCSVELNKRYGLQLGLYARAIETIIGRPVDRSLIWHIRSGRTYEIKPAL